MHHFIVHRLAPVLTCAVLLVAMSAGTVLAHAYPKTTDPQANARLDGAPAHLAIQYDSAIDARGLSMLLMDSSGATVATTPDSVDGNTRASVSPTTDLAPGPYTV